MRLDASAADQQPAAAAGRRRPRRRPARARSPRSSATADDGTPLRAWLVLPAAASARDPAPLLLWVHGGPLHSWNAWSWRWNPWIMAARGYAVLLPDPALSTGYGQEFVRRGWGRWGEAPYTDLMTVTDAAVARPDIDEERTAAMGGSFGGYMANWIAGHTDRFRAIVTHASLWALDQFAPDDRRLRLLAPRDDARDDGGQQPAPVRRRDPHADAGDPRRQGLPGADRRGPAAVGRARRTRSGEDGTMPHKFLYFPDENHWVLKPQHAKIWYQVVLAFLDATVHGKEWQVPDLLR